MISLLFVFVGRSLGVFIFISSLNGVTAAAAAAT
jgi:hypothetical protein